MGECSVRRAMRGKAEIWGAAEYRFSHQSVTPLLTKSSKQETRVRVTYIWGTEAVRDRAMDLPAAASCLCYTPHRLHPPGQILQQNITCYMFENSFRINCLCRSVLIQINIHQCQNTVLSNSKNAKSPEWAGKEKQLPTKEQHKLHGQGSLQTAGFCIVFIQSYQIFACHTVQQGYSKKVGETSGLMWVDCTATFESLINPWLWSTSLCTIICICKINLTKTKQTKTNQKRDRELGLSCDMACTFGRESWSYIYTYIHQPLSMSWGSLYYFPLHLQWLVRSCWP